MKKFGIKFLVAVLCVVICSMAVCMADEHVHNYDIWNVKTEATCAAAGEKVRICMDCGNVESEVIPALAHNYDVWNVKTEATCGAAGEKVRICVDCGNVESEAIPALAHNYDVWNVKTEATCAAAGEKVRICVDCGNVESEAIPATAHNYDVWNVKTEATCTADGEKVRICVDCGNVESEAIPAIGHTVVVDAAVDASCNKTGLTEGKHCSVCGEVLVAQEEVPGQQHAFVGSKVASTLTKGGYINWKCVNCGHTFVGNRTAPYAAAMGDIVFNAADEVMPYTVTEEEAACVITAEADADGVYTLRKLKLAEGMINDLKDLGKTEIHFVVGEYTLVIPMDVIAQEADLYVFIVDGTAEGGCLVKAETVTAEVAVDATNAMTGLKLRQGENEVEVTEAKVYVVAAQ